jgi:probable F420-dependent oxidoreductase
MKFGVHIFAADETAGIAELAAEGFEPFWLPEHTHIPISQESEWYRQELLREYSRTLDPFVALTWAAAATSALRAGTGVCLLAQHDPIVTAKAAAIDLISEGRLLFGVGLGWPAEEMRDHGVDPATRHSQAREVVLAMQGLWPQEQFGYHGRFASSEKSWLWPTPVQQSWPPLNAGGRGAASAFRDVPEFADAWMPDINMLRLSALPGLIAELSDACRERGRDPVPVTAVSTRADPERLEFLASLGLDWLIFLLPSAPNAAVFTALDDICRALGSDGLVAERAK